MPRDLTALLARKRGILLDLSFGGVPQANSVVLSPTGDIRRDPTRLPFPLPTGCVHTAVVTHVLEYVPPESIWAWFDDLHRILRPRGIVYLSGPHGTDESGWLSDPSHRTRMTEQAFAWLDPRLEYYALHATVGRRPPKPWHTVALSRVPGLHGTVSYNATLQAVAP